MSEPFARSRAPLCVVTLTYVSPIEAIDAAMADHVAWLGEGFAQDLIVVAGRQEPRTGGVILFRGHRAEVEALVASDPFVARGLARADVVAFTASMAAPALAEMLA